MGEPRRSWIGLVASCVTLFAFITGIGSLPELLASRAHPEQVSPIAASLASGLAFAVFAVAGMFLVGLSYVVSLYAARTFFGNRREYGILDGLVAGAVAVVFMVGHYSLYEVWWGKPFAGFGEIMPTGSALGGAFYMALSLILTAAVIQASHLWPVYTILARLTRADE